MEVKTFYNGNTMPQIGLGTFRVENDENCMESVKYAIEQGYRSIDTAKVYGNEEQVGAGIRAGIRFKILRFVSSTLARYERSRNG